MKFVVNLSHQFGSAVKEIRETKGLRQTDVARQVGMLPKTVSALENRPATVTIESLMKLLSALEYEIILTPKPKQDAFGFNELID